MSAELQLPSADLASRILATCRYADRLPAGRFTARVGIMRGTVRSMPELHLYLSPDDRSLPAVSFERLSDWIERVIKDDELAAATRSAASTSSSYVETCIATHALVEQRLAQARSVISSAGTEGKSLAGAHS